MEKEIWKTVYNYQDFNCEGLYQVSSFGNVLRLNNGKWQSQTLSVGNQGYLTFKAINNKNQEKTIRVHILVCTYFHGERPTRKVPDHINENKQDNRAANLE